MINSLSEIWNVVQRLKKRIHIASSALIFKTNITSFLFRVITPIINNFTHSNFSFHYTGIIYKITSTGVVEFTQRHK
uniref:Uncharacterized protein n=1 Tax=Arundo donax TaxID=35708 RepID=A0A0A9CVE2_ARUDO